MNILIIRLSAIGDVVHAMAAAAALRQHLPGCTLTWVVEEAAADILRGFPGLDRVIVSRRKRWLRDLMQFRIIRAIGQMRTFIRDLRRDRYDMVLDFQGLFKSGVVVGFSRGTRKRGYKNAREASTIFYTETAPATVFYDHAIKRHMDLITGLGVPETLPDFVLVFTDEDRQHINTFLADHSIDASRPLVCLHPSTKWPTKLWSAEKAAELCNRLQQHETGCRVLLAGGPEEKKYLDEIERLTGGEAKNLAGRTSLWQLACLIERSRLLITTDSGPMHVACASGTPVVALFGPTAPWRTGPFGKHHSVVRKELSCSPCFKRNKCPEKHHRCMRDITVEEVFKVCCNYL